MLRAGELGAIVDKAEVALALCDTQLMEEMVACAKHSPTTRCKGPYPHRGAEGHLALVH